MVAPHAGHLERPATNGSPRGTRWAMTLTKLPAIAPQTKAKEATMAMAWILI
jgi:hypothetical protein